MKQSIVKSSRSLSRVVAKTRKWPFALPVALLCLASSAGAQQPASVTIPVNSPAFAFSPSNWTGDAGRGGSRYRQTWYPGAYFRVSWSTSSAQPTAAILVDPSTYGSTVNTRPELTYNIDGIWKDGVSCSGNIPISGLSGSGNHVLTVYFATSEQKERWGSPGTSGLNVVRITGLQVDSSSTPGIAVRQPKWILEVGDSITEGSAANNGRSDNLADYSYFVGQALQTQGYEYGVNACGYSGWLRPGDATQDVPGYYVISGSANGAGGTYDETKSRWNKIDGNNHSLLDSRGHLSGYGQTGQEPSIITINYGTNDGLSHANASDTQASMTQSITALRRAAPNAQIFLIVPFGQYDAPLIYAGVKAYHAAHPSDADVSIIDLGPSVAKALSANGYWSGLHPNMRGHATFATQILAAIERRLHPASGKP